MARSAHRCEGCPSPSPSWPASSGEILTSIPFAIGATSRDGLRPVPHEAPEASRTVGVAVTVSLAPVAAALAGIFAEADQGRRGRGGEERSGYSQDGDPPEAHLVQNYCLGRLVSSADPGRSMVENNELDSFPCFAIRTIKFIAIRGCQ